MSRAVYVLYVVAASLCLFQPGEAIIKTAMAQSSSTTTTLLLTNMRPLYVFTPSVSDPRAVEQLATLHENRKEADERQLVLVLEDQSQTLAALPYDSKLRLNSQDSDQTAARHRFKVAPSDFTVVLVGKDGGEKLRSHQPIPFARLRETIDSMPMRRYEIREKK